MGHAIMITSPGFNVPKSSLMEAVQNSILWSSLSQAEQEQGVHPAKMTALKFDIDESALSGELLHKLRRFFVGCRLAASDSDFFSKSILMLHSNDQLLLPIKTIMESVLMAQMPKEDQHITDARLHFEVLNRSGANDEYQAKLAGIYSQLVEEKMCYLMHPARRFELVEYLGATFPDAELAADRLITYRCFGTSALRKSEIERTLQKHTEELEHVERKLSTLFENGPNLITRPMGLQEEALVCIPDELCRKYVCLAYKALALQGKLDCLDLPDEVLYKYQGGHDGIVHPNLAPFAEAYYNGSFPSNHFGTVVTYLKTLRNNDLNDLIETCLNEEKGRLRSLIDFDKNFYLERTNVSYQNQLRLLGKKPEDYSPGDFSFLSDPSDIRALTDTFNAVDRLKEWPFFDIEPPENKGYQRWKHPTINKILSEIGHYDHTGRSMEATFRTMRSVRKKGWNVVVRESIEDRTKTAGALNRAQRS